MAFCLTQPQEAKLREALVSGKLDPFVLSEMSSEERRAEFSKFIDPENAKNVNSLFESKLLLKNQIAGFKSWANSLIGVAPKVKRDLLTKIDRLSETGVLNPAEMKDFKEDLAKTRLGFSVTFEEAQTINDLAKTVDDLKVKTDPTKSDIALGRAKIDLLDYVNSLKPVKREILANVAGLPRSLMASLDLSAPLNQGWGMVSRKRFYTSLKTMLSTVKSENNFKNLQAWIITHPDYNTAKRAGLRITEIGEDLNKREEQFMSKLIDRVPGISASQRAYVGFLNKLRMDSFSDLLRKAEAAGENVTLGSTAAKDLANTVNSFTGGADVGKVEGAVPLLNALFFSPRKIKSTINMMNPATYISPKISKTARIEATRNLIGSLVMSISAIGLYALLTGEEPETDPTSADFGKIRSGDTRLDVTGGNATYANLLARIILGRIKNSSGVSTKLGTGYSETSAFDIIAQFVRNKLSPNASFLVDAVTGENAVGETKTVSESLIDRFKPLFLNSVVELLNSDTEGKFGFILGGLLGAGLNTYSVDADWNEKTTKEMVNFKDQVGEAKFKEANEKYNKEYQKWFEDVRNKQEYKDLDDEEKKDLITSSKKDIKDKILDEYGYDAGKKPATVEELREKEKIKKLKPVSQVDEETTKDVLIGMVGGFMDKITPDVMAAENMIISPENMEEQKKEPGFIEKIVNLVKKAFGKVEMVSAEGSGAVQAKKDGKQVSATGEYPYLLSHDGEKVKIYWPTGGYTEARNEAKADEILKNYEKNYKELTGEEWPDWAPSKLEENSKVSEPKKTRGEVKGVSVRGRGVKERTVDSDSFVESVIVPIAKEYGIHPAGPAGQFGAEGRLGGLGAGRNNFFNIGAFDNNEDNAYSYPSPEAGVRAYMELIKRKYPEAYKHRDDPVKFLKEVKKGGYATRKDYVEFIMNTPEWRKYL